MTYEEQEQMGINLIDVMTTGKSAEPIRRVLLTGSPAGDYYTEIAMGWPIPQAMVTRHPVTEIEEVYEIPDGVGIYQGAYDGSNF